MAHRIISSIVASLAALVALSASGQESVDSGISSGDQIAESASQQYAPGTITSTEAADRALDDVKRQRALVEARFAEEEAVCHKKFFVTSCMDAAKDRRRIALKQLNAIEVEANAYHRRARVERKEQALRERQVKQEARAAEKGDMQSSGAQAEARATPQDIAEIESRSQQAAPAPAAEPAKNYNAERAARHEEELAQERAKDSVEAAKREKNIKDYERKRQRSLERQREIAAKKQEKEQKRQQGAAGKP